MKNVTKYKMRVLIFTKIFDQIIFLRSVERDIIINEHMSLCNVTVVIIRYSLKLNSLNRFLTNTQDIIFKDLSIGGRVVPCRQIHRWSNKQDERNSRFLQIYEGA